VTAIFLKGIPRKAPRTQKKDGFRKKGERGGFHETAGKAKVKKLVPREKKDLARRSQFRELSQGGRRELLYPGKGAERWKGGGV